MSYSRPEETARTIRASEIGEFGYCRRAWWYKHVIKLPAPAGEAESRLAAGTRAHARHGRAVATSLALRRIGLALAALGLLVLALALLASLVG